ncbi:MAG: DNA-binding protein [Candidatus Aenigmarchaeota archaeon]|nr:DNA-binding protein [Candidatus Aenigmarchaeota archaeon]
MADDEEAIRRIMQKRMQEQMQQQAESQMQQAQLEAALKVITSQILDTKARERLSNLKYVKPDLAIQLEMYLAQLYQSGQLRTKITDEQLVMILRKLTEKKETTIKRK